MKKIVVLIVLLLVAGNKTYTVTVRDSLKNASGGAVKGSISFSTVPFSFTTSKQKR